MCVCLDDEIRFYCDEEKRLWYWKYFEILYIFLKTQQEMFKLVFWGLIELKGSEMAKDKKQRNVCFCLIYNIIM